MHPFGLTVSHYHPPHVACGCRGHHTLSTALSHANYREGIHERAGGFRQRHTLWELNAMHSLGNRILGVWSILVFCKEGHAISSEFVSQQSATDGNEEFSPVLFNNPRTFEPRNRVAQRFRTGAFRLKKKLVKLRDRCRIHFDQHLAWLWWWDGYLLQHRRNIHNEGFHEIIVIWLNI